MSDVYPVTGEVRVISLTLEQEQGRIWYVACHVEHRTAGRRRGLLQRVARFRMRVDHPVATMSAVEEVLAQAVLQRRLPGID